MIKYNFVEQGILRKTIDDNGKILEWAIFPDKEHAPKPIQNDKHYQELMNKMAKKEIDILQKE